MIAAIGGMPIGTSAVKDDEANLMKPLARYRRLLVAATLLALSAGCGSGKVPLQPVHGTVYFQERPLTRGTIVFTPDASRGHAGAIACSEIKPDGTYALQTQNEAGAAPGWYRITVLAVELPAQPENGDRYASPHSLLPEKYRDPDLAELVREILPGKENRIDLHLD
jgi:hypothetical protein